MANTDLIIVLRLAERLGLDEAERGVVYYVGLLAWVECHVDAYEQAKWFGDDTAFEGDSRRVDFGRSLPAAAFMSRHIGARRVLGTGFWIRTFSTVNGHKHHDDLPRLAPDIPPYLGVLALPWRAETYWRYRSAV